MSWKLPQDDINKAVANFIKLDCLHGCGCQWWSFRASAITLSISNSASSFQSHQQTTDEDYIRNAEKWGLSRLKQHNFIVFRYNSTKRRIKVYILLLKSDRPNKILRKNLHALLKYFLCSPCTFPQNWSTMSSSQFFQSNNLDTSFDALASGRYLKYVIVITELFYDMLASDAITNQRKYKGICSLWLCVFVYLHIKRYVTDLCDRSRCSID